MARYRIRYQGTDLEMPPGEFIVGRSSACNLALDDALVSRKHACIQVQPDGVFVEDLGSRNGVLVNGDRIAGRRKLSHLDRVAIGSHELVLVEVPDRPAANAVCEACGAPVSIDMVVCQRCRHPLHKGNPTLAGMTLEIPLIKADILKTAKHEALRADVGRGEVGRADVGRIEAGRSDATWSSDGGSGARSLPEENTGRALLTGIADKALALGRYDEAERVIGKSLHEVLARARTGSVPPPARIVEATRYALRLAEGTRRTAWLDWVFDTHEAAGKLLGADEIERVHELVRKLRYTGVGPVRRYVAAMRAREAGFTPAERFLLSRLEGIERMVSA